MLGMLGTLITAQLLAGMPAKDAPADTAQQAVASRAPGSSWLGAKVDAGLPDGAGVSVVLRPLPWLRLEGGGIHNSVAPGIRAGVTFIPVRSWISPTLSGEAGHYFQGNANRLAAQLTEDPRFTSTFLDRVSYDFETAQLGVELGSQRRMLFFAQAGYTHVDLKMTSFTQGLQRFSNGTWSGDPLTVHLNGISAKLGFIVYVG